MGYPVKEKKIDVIKSNPPRATVTFGPGSLESLKLTTWTTKHRVGRVKVVGDYLVYCGFGGTHTVAIDVWDAAEDHVGAEPEEVAEVLVGYGLEGYSCSCHYGEEW